MSCAIFLASCSSNEDEDTNLSALNDSYLFVADEGSYPSSGSITKVNLTQNTSTLDFYSSANDGAELGTTVQSVFVYENKLFACVSGADQVVVLNSETGIHEDVISMSYPRYMIQNNGFGYISSGNYQGKVVKIDLKTNSIIDTIAVGNGPEKLTVINEKLVVANSGGYTRDSSITVIDLPSFSVDTTVIIAEKINDVKVDAYGKVWALSAVNWQVGNSPTLYKLNSSTWAIEDSIIVGNENDYVGKFAISNDREYIFIALAGGVFKLPVTNSELPSTSITGGSWYGIELSEDDKLYLFKGNFSANGYVNEYSFEGDSLNSYETGVASNGGFFLN